MWKHVPNILTFIRLGLTFVFFGLILYSPRAEAASLALLLDGAFVLFLVAAVTDVADGIIARRYNASTKFGRMIDPLVDKVLVCGAFICFALIGVPQLFGLGPGALAAIHWSVAAIIIVREVYVTILRHIAESRGINFGAVASGKIKMFLQSFAIGTVLIKTAHIRQAAWANWFTVLVFAAMVVMTVISGLEATKRTKAPQLVSV